MRGQRSIVCLTAAVAWVGGCKREVASTTTRPPTPATRQATAATLPATQPAEPATSLFVINDQAFSFPAPKLVAKPTAGGVRVTLFSDDPPEAVRDTYRGNSFYFRFAIDSADTAADLDGQQFVFRNSAAEDDDTTNGIFIAGGKQTLRPLEAAITFEKVGGQLVARVAGTFKLTDEQTGPDNPATVTVRAEFEPALVDAAKK